MLPRSEVFRKQINDMTQKGWPITQALRDQLAEAERQEADNARFKAEREKEIADRKAAEAAAREAAVENALKAEARSAYEMAGGRPADFEAAWPGLRTRILEQRTLAQVQAPESIRAKKLASGNYNL